MKTLLFTLFFTLLNLGANCQNTHVDSIFVMIDTSINKIYSYLKKNKSTLVHQSKYLCMLGK
jgi:hypothetical protein